MVISNVNEYVAAYAAGSVVLYMGAGDDRGNLAPGAALVLSTARLFIGVDRDKTLAEKYHPRIFWHDLNQDFDFVSSPLPQSQIELVIMTEVLEHLHSPVGTLSRLRQRFRGAELVGSVPNGLSAGRFLMGIFAPRLYESQDRDHYYLFNPSTIWNVLRAADLSHIIKIVPYEQRRYLRPVARMFPLLASGFVFHARL